MTTAGTPIPFAGTVVGGAVTPPSPIKGSASRAPSGYAKVNFAMPEIDGGLVGGASLDPDEFARVVQYGLR